MTISKPRVRFAPSPTGHLHIGGARTALFNFLYARHHGGIFVLRIEDTDKERSTPEATEAIIEGMKWLGLTWDEGPFFQSQRNDLYKKKLAMLVENGNAYKCYCTSEELDARRKAQMAEKKPPKYDGRCRELMGKNVDKPFTLRALVPAGRTEVADLVKGDTSFNNQELEDTILARTDGSPTYNFVVVVDDIDMGITHVIRGDDHLNNTPKQILLYKALGAEVPKFAHLPMILGADRQRLSKRHGATSVQAYREMGYLPHALLNFLARLGWSHKDQEIFSMEEMIEKFSLEVVGSSAGVFNSEKLLWLNQHYVKSEPAEKLLEEMARFIEIPEARRQGEGWKTCIELLRERAKTVTEMAELARFYFLDDVTFDDKAVQKFLTPEIAGPMKKLLEMLGGCSLFDEATVKPKFEALLEDIGLKMTQLAQPLRVALTGGTVSPSIYDVLALLGRERVLPRVEAAIAKIGKTTTQ